MSSSILVKFRSSENFINMRTVTRSRKSPSFDLHRFAFTDLEATGHITVKDGYSFADIRLIDGGASVQIDFSWLTQYGDKTLKGFVQTVYLDYDALANRMWESLEGNNGPRYWSMLSIDRIPQRPRLDFSSDGARETLRRILGVPVLRHKLAKAVCDNFQWPSNDPGHTVYFYADWDRYSFFFREVQDGKEGICGGLILDHYNGFEKARYSVHT